MCVVSVFTGHRTATQTGPRETTGVGRTEENGQDKEEKEDGILSNIKHAFSDHMTGKISVALATW